MNNIDAQHFSKINFSIEPPATGNYEKCTFVQCDFSGADLAHLHFYECSFTGCNLSLVRFSNNTLNDIVFKDCKLMGVHFEHCNQILFTVSFEKCILNLSSWYTMKAKKTRFAHCTIHEADFTGADLSHAIFDHCDLMGSTFQESKLEQADFTSAYNYLIDPESNRIKRAKFSKEGIPGLLYKYDIVIE